MNKALLKKGLMISAIAITMVGSFFAGSYNPVVAEANTTVPANEISVNGSGAVYAKPDTAVLNIGVETSHKESQTAQTENTKQTNQVMEALKALGIKEEDIKTSYYNLYQERYYNTESGVPANGDYRVSHSLEVTVRNLEEVGKVIDTVSKSGANQINGVRFTVSDTSKYYQEALKRAIADAGVKAGTIAGAINVKIDKPSKVVENSYNYPVVGAYMEAESLVRAAADVKTEIYSGELEITAQVQVTYNY